MALSASTSNLPKAALLPPLRQSRTYSLVLKRFPECGSANTGIGLRLSFVNAMLGLPPSPTLSVKPS